MKQPSSSKYDYSPPPNPDWQLIFAWYPVKINNEWYWCVDVMRRYKIDPQGFWISSYEYRLPTDNDKQKYIENHHGH